MSAYVQNDTGEGNPATVQFSSSPTEGNLLLISQFCRTGQTGATLSGSTGWTKILERNTLTGSSSARRSLAIWAKISEGDETGVISLNFGTGTTTKAVIEEYEPAPGYVWDAVADAIFASNDNGETNNAASIATGTTANITTDRNFVYGVLGCRNDTTQFPSGATWSAIALTAQTDDPTVGAGRMISTGWDDDNVTGTRASTATLTPGTQQNQGLSAAIVVFAQSLSGAVAIAQDVNTIGTGGLNTVVSASFTPTDGNVILVCAFAHDNNVTDITISDSFGEGWTWNPRVAFGQADPAWGPDLHYRAWSVTVTGTPGAGTISVSSGAVQTNGWDVMFMEFVGVDTATNDGVVDTDVVTDAAGTSAVGSLPGTSGNAAVGMGSIEEDAAASFGPVSPLVTRTSGSDSAPDHQTDISFSPTETATPTYDWTGNEDYLAIYFELKPLGGAEQLAGSAAGAGDATGELALTVQLAGAAAGAGAAAAVLTVIHQLAGLAAGAGSASGFLRKPLVAAIAGPPLPQLARVSVHDNAFRKVGELRTASAVERSYELGAPGLASLTISRDDPLIAATRPGAGNVIAIESPDYPFPWVGAIDRRQGSDAAGISLQARGFAAILGDRFLPSTFQTELTAADEIVRVLEIVNNRNNTAIRPGRVQDSGASIPDLVFPNARASAAMDAIAEAGGIEYWVDYEVEPSNILPLLQIQASRGFDRFRTVVLEDGFNATFDEWIEDGGAAAFALTVIAGQTTVTESFTERSRATKIVEEAGGFVTQFVPIGPTPSGEIVDVGGGVKRKDSGISFPHGFARFAEVIVESPATRREVTVIREELRSRDITVQTADSLLRVRPIPERVLAGAAIRKSDWRVLEVGDVVRVVAPNSFVTGFDGPARIIGTEPDEANGRMGLVVELLREVA